MSKLTNPADELARACDAIVRVNSSEAGQKVLATAFDVPAWSREYYEIIFCLTDQADRIFRILVAQQLDAAFLARARKSIDGIKAAFTPQQLGHAWNQQNSSRQTLLKHVDAIHMLSPTVALSGQYPKLSQEEADGLGEDIDQLLEWLQNHQLEDNDFIRAALIDGLRTYRFRLTKIQWLGWHYSMETLRATIGAYLALERGDMPAGAMPITQAALTKVASLFSKIWSLTGQVDAATNRLNTAIKLYALASAVMQGTPIIAAIAHQAS